MFKALLLVRKVLLSKIIPSQMSLKSKQHQIKKNTFLSLSQRLDDEALSSSQVSLNQLCLFLQKSDVLANKFPTLAKNKKYRQNWILFHINLLQKQISMLKLHNQKNQQTIKSSFILKLNQYLKTDTFPYIEKYLNMQFLDFNLTGKNYLKSQEFILKNQNKLQKDNKLIKDQTDKMEKNQIHTQIKSFQEQIKDKIYQSQIQIESEQLQQMCKYFQEYTKYFQGKKWKDLVQSQVHLVSSFSDQSNSQFKNQQKSIQVKKSHQEDLIKQNKNVKKIIMKGKIPVDDHFPHDKTIYSVLQHQGKVYSATLNQTNVSQNNNKFYIIQVLQQGQSMDQNLFFCRWGRVGAAGTSSCSKAMSLKQAISNFNSKYREKHDKGGYREVDISYQDNSEIINVKQSQDKQKILRESKSKLQKPVKDLISLIFDLKMMNKQMKQIGYNVDKMPLGKLSKDSVKKGYEILKSLLDQINIKKQKQSTAAIEKLTSEFYSYIPHDFGFKKVKNFILDTEQKVAKKIQMLEALSEIKIATSILEQNNQCQDIIGSNYAQLKRDITHLNESTQQYKTILKYLSTTHAKYHNQYSLQLADLFKLNNQKENSCYKKQFHNKKLLWHGSRLTNFVGILSRGLRIAPPQAPSTGYMFGKGIYFADMCSKSANYCNANSHNKTGILLLCQVALGNMNEKTSGDSRADQLPKGKNSTKGLGKTIPDQKNQILTEQGVAIPLGPCIQLSNNYQLRHNQFIVYDTSQVKIKYLLRVNFNYKTK